MSKHVSVVEARFAVVTALEGQKWLLFKWRGDYGLKNTRVRDSRIEEIQQDIQRLKKFKEDLK
jgi:hypothetical protein